MADLGMLITVAPSLAMDALGPMRDNAGGVAGKAGMSHRVRKRMNTLAAVGTTTAARGRGFAMGLATPVTLALLGALVSRVEFPTGEGLTPKVFVGLMVGAMLPYWFSAMTKKSVGSAALQMGAEVRRLFHTIPGLMEGRVMPNYATCVI
ncbi:pyrophosphate-energized vacuolar membrane proton pump-like [Aristolochia californica]|uniref:pyrophosphate-energized vacuolar membrane proton pump-like n=1 Tax=Aristolochia californica TaxID=171875 RepID=UPI0035D678E3